MHRQTQGPPLPYAPARFTGDVSGELYHYSVSPALLSFQVCTGTLACWMQHAQHPLH